MTWYEEMGAEMTWYDWADAAGVDRHTADPAPLKAWMERDDPRIWRDSVRGSEARTP